MAKAKLSLIVTVFNEQATISRFIESVYNQSKLPDELIIVDGGSTDNTLLEISNYRYSRGKKHLKIKLLTKKGNRSVGRNEAIKNAKGKIILCSDAGCILDRDWVKNITKPFQDKSVDVVAGFYKGNSKTVFQRSLIPYVLVMEDKIKESEFLPATRSMAFKKNIWKKAGGFDEKLSHNEDYAFANKLKEINAKIVFERKAIVHWIPRKNLNETFIMFFRFAFGDAESGILRDKVLLIFARYTFYLYLIILFFLIKSFFLLFIGIFLPIFYIFWSIRKNYKYVNHPKAFVLFPILQLTSDIAVLAGTGLGFFKFFLKIDYKTIFKSNFALITLLIIYIITILSVITSGIPNQTHPFNYQMDEWHQMQSVRNVFKYGSPNLTGSANGTMFNFFLSGIMLVPFYLTKIINPFLIKSAVDALQEQEKLFIILRLFTLIFGVLTLIIIYKMAKVLKWNSFLTVFIFIFTPVWLALSNFFKYDIALTFWVTLSMLYLIKYAYSPSSKHFLIGSFLCAVAFSVKVSGLPMFLLLILSYFLFTPSFKKHYQRLFLGTAIFIFFSIFLGIPDIVFGGKNMNDYLFSNIVSGPSEMLQNYNLDYSLLNLTFLHKLPAIFGHVLYALTIFSLFYISISTISDWIKRNYFESKLKFFLIMSFLLFCISLVPLGIMISANRLVALLPFIVILDMLAFKEILSIFKNKKLFTGILGLLLIILLSAQLFESYLWVMLKSSILPQQSSSAWILKNIPANSSIGIENIPIYQFEPDFILKEFYSKQYYPNAVTKYKYSIIDSKTKNFPKYIILSNINYDNKYLKKSTKNDLVKKIKNDNYSKIAYFPLEIPYYNYFDNYFYYPFVGLFAYPDGISIYEKK
ncbi:MAG: glycosyltransferase [Patescibacteria group bacterium]|nr:glycosyltransferase [Patescibacteria group bacterium]